MVFWSKVQDRGRYEVCFCSRTIKRKANSKRLDSRTKVPNSSEPTCERRTASRDSHWTSLVEDAVTRQWHKEVLGLVGSRCCNVGKVSRDDTSEIADAVAHEVGKRRILLVEDRSESATVLACERAGRKVLNSPLMQLGQSDFEGC